MRVILHIGAPKTGTTAIQNFLWDYRKIIYERYYCLYPETGAVGKAHFALTWSFYTNPPVETILNKVNKRKEEILLDLKRECMIKNPELMIISCEGLYFLGNNELKTFSYLIREFLTCDIPN